VLLNLYSNDHMTRVMWHASKTHTRAGITSTENH